MVLVHALGKVSIELIAIYFHSFEIFIIQIGETAFCKSEFITYYQIKLFSECSKSINFAHYYAVAKCHFEKCLLVVVDNDLNYLNLIFVCDFIELYFFIQGVLQLPTVKETRHFPFKDHRRFLHDG
jgi:hypothetical protein